MFIYRPHVHGLEITTTPDLILEIAGLSSDVHWNGRKASVAAAWVVVAAGYGPLLTVGLLDDAAPWIVARNAWRLADVKLEDIYIAFDGGTAALAGNASAPDAGQARFVAAPLLPLSRPAACEVSLFDRRLRRRLSHSFLFLENER